MANIWSSSCMRYKASLHLHSKEDFMDGKIIDYDIFELIDEAKNKDFDILALTCHEKFIFSEEYREYAMKKGILLIPGIELALNKTFFTQEHMLVLNCDKSAETIKDFKDLEKYKQENPSCFIIAPHPGFDIFNSISFKNLILHIDIFDAIEHSWCYSDLWNKNKEAIKIAQISDKPMISTSDVHFLGLLDMDYAIIESDSLEIGDIFENIRNKRFENMTKEKPFLMITKTVFTMFWRTFFRKKR
ncbi:MAG: PHP domain-containing protein [Candidatus Gracilibacteria bacterium]|nr:PHP domain-containing protein [Candidatus Gracilibacteria bacterium]